VLVKQAKDPAKLDLGSVIVGSVGEDPKKLPAKAPRENGCHVPRQQSAEYSRLCRHACSSCAGLTFDEIRPIAEAMEQGGKKSRRPAAVTDACSAESVPNRRHTVAVY